VIITAVLAAAGGVGALVFLRMRKPQQAKLQPPQKLEEPKDLLENSKATPVLQPVPTEVVEEDEMEDVDDPAEPLLEGNSSVPYQIPDSLIDKSILSRIVGRVIEDRPNLRQEDQQVLKFLVEKEGAAFESEIRSKFQLPKTTIWRLVKRLEREELVEIRKAGGQNLIKLKFEDKQA
jgi:hypothetical protein